jgi:hypothetical protein
MVVVVTAEVELTPDPPPPTSGVVVATGAKVGATFVAADGLPSLPPHAAETLSTTAVEQARTR